jgi:Zn-dependent protease
VTDTPSMFQGFDLNKLVVMIVPLLFAVTIHEVAHGWVAYRLGDPTAKRSGRLTLNPLKHLDPMGSFLLPLMLFLLRSPVIFGYAKPVPVSFHNLRNYRRDAILVSSAGVAANLMCALACGLLFQTLGRIKPLWDSLIFVDLLAMLAYSVLINCVLAFFNLIPIPPLDGGRILSMLVPSKYAGVLARMERFGMLIVFFLLFTGVLNSVISLVLNPALRLFLGGEGLRMFSYVHGVMGDIFNG